LAIEFLDEASLVEGTCLATFPLTSEEFFNTTVHNSVEKAESWCVTCLVTKRFYRLHTLGCDNDQVKKLSEKIRLDKLLLDRGLVPSRERAQALILAADVLVDNQKITKPGTLVSSSAELRLLGEDLKYVSRGGLKLERALNHWHIDVSGKVCLDIGASTGGFTDCLLQHGAVRVIAVDTGHGQIAYKLRQDERVRLLEKTNARYLTREQVSETVDLIVMDVSFISATLVIPAVVASGFPENHDDRAGRNVIVLVKPQFEAGREHVGKGGIVRDPEVQQQAVGRVRDAVLGLGANSTDAIDSPILGAEGNREFLLLGQF
jgi:23S rRNA (cytidine1920-2'-O)/16S rRNA (cytidine1409-2'-O)-methyltransferase